ncbi:MAG: hypothetical protein IPH06_06785 [Alphaproteobacteria bacterium]|nr:hypothetical protein [Alphaproteobacteria bacterium]QQS57721.1 MAG: hypothetical protein IPN28_02550 [Alphaproteobacteria bacterium]
MDSDLRWNDGPPNVTPAQAGVHGQAFTERTGLSTARVMPAVPPVFQKNPLPSS